MPLDWITTNGARSAFQESQQFEQQQELNALRLREAQRQDRKGAALAASEIEAGQAQNARTVLETDTYRQTQPDVIRNSRSGAALNETRASEGAYDFQEKQDRRGLRDVTARSQEKAAVASEEQIEINELKEIVGYIEKGQPQMAKRVAAKYGQELPDEFINDLSKGQAVKGLLEHAERMHPNNPRKQYDYMRRGIDYLREKGTQPQDIVRDPTIPYDIPGAPIPDEAGGQGRQNDFQIKMQAFKALGYSDRDAANIAMGNKPASDQEMIEAARKLSDSFHPTSSFDFNPTAKKKFFDETLAALRSQTFGRPDGYVPPEPGGAPAPASGGLVPGSSAGDGSDMAPRAAPAPAQQAPAPSARPPAAASQMQGGGTREDPYQIDSQERAAWALKNLQPGTFVVYEGEVYEVP